MLKTESRIGVIKETDEKIFQFLSDFNHFKSLIPADRIKDFKSSGDTCRFNVEGIGELGLRIIQKDPHKLIKIGSDETTPFEFTMWVQIKELSKGDSRMKITMEVAINPMMAGMVKKPIKDFVDTLIDQAENISYEPTA
jgi:carbon monoxide dehydrogenase subunit G